MKGLEGDKLVLFYFDFTRNCVPLDAPNAELRPCRWMPGRLAQYAWKTFNWPPFDLFAGKADLYHFPNFIIPPLCGGKTVVTIHDMSFLRYPQYTEELNLTYLKGGISTTIGRADAIITDSAFSAKEIIALTGAPPGKVHAIHLGISPSFAPPGEDAVGNCLSRLGIDRPYLLTVGTVEPRKNIPLIVEMFEKMKDFDGALVIAGRLGWKYQGTLNKIRNSRRASKIILLNNLCDSDLPALYAGASLFVIASFYEGFGFTPLEAMACGAPVLSSQGGSLPEILGNAAVIARTFDPEEWAGRGLQILGDNDMRRQLIARGLAQAAGYSWRETARKTLDVYRSICK
jgi:glycosyltransferase involved in cell wall biosynthesis